MNIEKRISLCLLSQKIEQNNKYTSYGHFTDNSHYRAKGKEEPKEGYEGKSKDHIPIN